MKACARSILVVSMVLASLAGTMAAVPDRDDGAARTRPPASLRVASLDGIDADLVYGRMAVDVRANIVRLQVTRASGVTGLCMGALVDRRYVLTAGHCLREAKTIEATRRPVRGGPEQTARVRDWVVHPMAEGGPSASPSASGGEPGTTLRTVHLRRDLGLILLAEDFPAPRGTLRLAEEHVLRDWTRAAAVLGFDRNRDTRELTDRLSLIPLRRVHGLAGGGAVVSGEVGTVFDHELADLPVPARLAYCQGDSGAPVLAHLRMVPRTAGPARHEVRLIGVAALGARAVPPFGRVKPGTGVGCFREVVWFSLTDPAARRWFVEAEALLGRRHCLTARGDEWCNANRRGDAP